MFSLPGRPSTSSVFHNTTARILALPSASLSRVLHCYEPPALLRRSPLLCEGGAHGHWQYRLQAGGGPRNLQRRLSNPACEACERKSVQQQGAACMEGQVCNGQEAVQNSTQARRCRAPKAANECGDDICGAVWLVLVHGMPGLQQSSAARQGLRPALASPLETQPSSCSFDNCLGSTTRSPALAHLAAPVAAARAGTCPASARSSAAGPAGRCPPAPAPARHEDPTIETVECTLSNTRRGPPCLFSCAAVPPRRAKQHTCTRLGRPAAYLGHRQLEEHVAQAGVPALPVGRRLLQLRAPHPPWAAASAAPARAPAAAARCPGGWCWCGSRPRWRGRARRQLCLLWLRLPLLRLDPALLFPLFRQGFQPPCRQVACRACSRCACALASLPQPQHGRQRDVGCLLPLAHACSGSNGGVPAVHGGSSGSTLAAGMCAQPGCTTVRCWALQAKTG